MSNNKSAEPVIVVGGGWAGLAAAVELAERLPQAADLLERFFSESKEFGLDKPDRMVLVDGQFIMRDRKILSVDETSLVAEADKVGRRVWSQVEAASPVIVPRLPRR